MKPLALSIMFAEGQRFSTVQILESLPLLMENELTGTAGDNGDD